MPPEAGPSQYARLIHVPLQRAANDEAISSSDDDDTVGAGILMLRVRVPRAPWVPLH